jgi:hypothetical protein
MSKSEASALCGAEWALNSARCEATCSLHEAGRFGEAQVFSFAVVCLSSKSDLLSVPHLNGLHHRGLIAVWLKRGDRRDYSLGYL